MSDVLGAAVAQREARKIASQAAEAEAARVATAVATDIASEVATRTANGRLPADVAAFLRANPPAPGTPGAPGADGEPGIAWRGPWRRSEDYLPGDAVEDGGSSYVASMPSHGERPPSSSWDLLAKKGEQGEPGRSFRGGGGGGGGAGPVGETGPTGAAGTTWLAGAGVPDDGNGVNGDLYLDTTTGDVYEKVAGTWF